MNLLGIDYGEKYVGIAVSYGIVATPLKTVFKNEAILEIVRLTHELVIDRCILGLPEGRLAKAVALFGSSLKKEISCPLFFWDETTTSKIAQNLLRQSPRSQKRRHEKEHETAAAVMLQSYLDDQKESI